jgi:hypothetical protein
LRLKNGVSINGIGPNIIAVLAPAALIWERHGQELVVTSGTDGDHSEGSLHYVGLALDFRTRYFGLDQSFEVAADLRKALGMDYDIVLHSSHLHIEWDPK